VDETVIRYYRGLLSAGFENAGSFDNPSIFLDPVGEGIPFCGHPSGYMRIYISVSNDRISDIKYLCNCDPTENVAVEVLCGLVKGRTLEEVAATTESSFSQVVGGRSKELRKKAKRLLELLDRGLTRYRAEVREGRS